MIAGGEELLVGLVVLAVLPLLALRIWRGLQTGSLPIYRTYLHRDEDRAKFTTLLVIHVAIFALMVFIAADLLLGLGFRNPA
jgi:hypothetical protein